jgi:YD repeat-containing protein
MQIAVSPACLRTTLPRAFTAVALVLLSSMPCVVAAQTPAHDAAAQMGLQRGRSYFSPEPFEHYDTLSGNVLLTFTDLVLPGNAGSELRFQRTYNNIAGRRAASDSFDTLSRWSFGFPGIPMRVLERPVPVDYEFEYDFPHVNWQTTPVLVMGDGSLRSTTYVSAPGQSNPAPTADVMSPEFYRYSRADRVLLMPNGTVCYYAAGSGRLISFHDQFGNLVELDWGESSLVVRQHLGNEQVREVVLTLDSGSRVTAMQHEDRIWRYEYNFEWSVFRDITAVIPPAGPRWTFAYDPGVVPDVKTMTTPNGGRVEYAYRDVEVPYDPENPGGVSLRLHVLRTRESFDRDGTSLGVWTLDWQNPSVGAAVITDIRTPANVVVQHWHRELTGDPFNQAFGGNFGLTSRSVTVDGQTVQSESWDYELRPVVDFGTQFHSWGPPVLKDYRITRDGRQFRTQYLYGTANFSDYHNPVRVIETGHSTRTTDYTYSHLTSLWVKGLKLTEEVQAGGETAKRRWTYNTRGFRTSEVGWYRPSQTSGGIVTTYTEGAFGNLAAVRKANNKLTSFSYAWGQISEVNTNQHSTTRTLNTDGTIAWETQASRTTTYAYDKLGRVTRVDGPGGTNPTVNEYDDLAGASFTTRRGASFVTTTLDGFGRAVATIDSVGVQTRMEYDAEGRVKAQSYPFDASRPEIHTLFYYDALDRLIRRVNPDQTSKVQSYGDGTIMTVDEKNRLTIRRMRAFGHPDHARLVELVDPDDKVWEYSYNIIGQLTGVTTEDALSRSWTYDSKFLLESERHPESGTTTYQYDTAGVVSRKTDQKGTLFQYTYDGNDRLRQINAGTEVTSITYEPGSDNRQLTLVGTTQSSEFLWDGAGRLAGRTDSIDGRVFDTRYEYDANDDLIGIYYPAQANTIRRRVGYAYDAEHRLTRIWNLLNDRSYASNFQYHPSGALTEYTAGNGVRSAFDYHPSRYWLTSLTVRDWQLQYGYDAVGNVEALTDSREGMSQTFTYDRLDRLQAAVGPYGAALYVYDQHGNRQSVNGSTYAYWPGTLRLRQQGVESYMYDNNGNLETAPNRTYAYSPHNMLRTATVLGATTTYGYDADQMRIKRTGADGAVTYYFHGPSGELLTEWRNPGASGTIRDYIYAGSRLVGVLGRPSLPDESDITGTIVPDGPSLSVTLASGQNALLTFQGVAGQQVSASVMATSPTTFGSWWDIRILKPDGTQLVQATVGSGSSVGFVDAVTLPVAGTYTLMIDPRNTLSGTVTATLYNVVHQTGPIATNGTAVDVLLATPGQNGRLTFEATAGQTFSASIHWMSAGGFGAWWDLRLFNPDGTQLAYITPNSGSKVGFLDVRSLPATGTYTLVIDPRAMLTGTVAARVYAITHVTTTIPTNGTAVPVAITTPGQNGRLPFEGVAGQLVSASMILTSPGGFGSWWDLRILKPDGTQLVYATASSGTTFGFIDTVSLPVTGTYTLVVDPRDMLTGTVDAHVYTVSHVTTPIEQGGAPVPVAVITPGQNGRLPFAAAAGDLVSASAITVPPSTYGSWWDLRILRPDGTQLVSAMPSTGTTIGFVDTVALPVAGTYTFVIDPRQMLLGAVDARVYGVSHVTTPIATDGSAVSVNLSTPGQNGRLPFTAAAGQVVSVSVTAVSPSTFGSWWDLRILRPDGTQLVTSQINTGWATGSMNNITLPVAGTYTLVIDPRATLTGAVSVRITSP